MNAALQDLMDSRRKLGHGWRHETVTVEKCDVTVYYTVHGQYMSATETDPAETPWIEIELLMIGNQDATELLRTYGIADECARIVEERMNG